jgi:hypothetical protein
MCVFLELKQVRVLIKASVLLVILLTELKQVRVLTKAS